MSQYRAKKKSRRTKIKYKKKKSVWKNPVFRLVFLGIILVISAAYLLLFSPLLAIREIKITAPDGLSNIIPRVNDLLNNELEKRLVIFSFRKSFFLLKTEDIKKKIKAMEPAVEEALVKKAFSHTLVLELKERTPEAVWCYAQNNVCYLIDKKGVIFKQSANVEQGLVMISAETEPSDKTPLEVIEPAKMAQISEILNFFNGTLKIKPQQFITDTQEKLNLKTEEGWEVYFLLGGDIKTSLIKLQLLIEKKLPQAKRKNLQYIDLRFSKVYYK